MNKQFPTLGVCVCFCSTISDNLNMFQAINVIRVAEPIRTKGLIKVQGVLTLIFFRLDLIIYFLYYGQGLFSYEKEGLWCSS